MDLKSTRRTVTTPTATSNAQAQSISQKLYWKFHSTLCFQSLDLDPRKASCCKRYKAFIFSKEGLLISLSTTPLCETFCFSVGLPFLLFVWQHKTFQENIPFYIYIYSTYIIRRIYIQIKIRIRRRHAQSEMKNKCTTEVDM